MTQLTTQERFKRGAADAGRYFQFMAEFVGYEESYADAIRDTRFVIEKHIPRIVADFYTHLLSFPSTRKHFQKKDGTIDEAYLALRMQHQATFWRRTATAVFDEDYARFVDYVGRAHTSQGADASIYIPERYVMGMIGFVQQRIVEALSAELHGVDPDLEVRAIKAWNALLMVLLEALSRVYGEGREMETYQSAETIDEMPIQQLALETYERSLGIARAVEYREVLVGRVDEFREGSRKIVDSKGLSIGVFFVAGQWQALQNSCLHRGGPVCQGTLQEGVLTCPWHGYEYQLTTGQLLLDPDAKLPSYAVEVRGEEVVLRIPVLVRDEVEISLGDLFTKTEVKARLAANEFLLSELMPGQTKLVHVESVAVAVYNAEGTLYATQDACSHVDGPLSEGTLDGTTIVCPWHASCFDVTTGEVLVGPATEPLQIYQVEIDGDIGRVLPTETD